MSTTESAIAASSDTLWTVAEVAAYLRVSKSWVYHRLESGLLPHIRVGALVRFYPDAIREYVIKGSSAVPDRAVSATIRCAR